MALNMQTQQQHRSGLGIAFSPSGADIAIAHLTTPFVSAYPWSSGFGTKYANPTTLPPQAGRSVSFNATGNTIAIGGDSSTTSALSLYPWSAGFGTQYTGPAAQIGNSVYSVKFN